MPNKLVLKLKNHLSAPVETECDLVYLISGVRKLLDRNEPTTLVNLRMYCNWALHIDLERPGTTLHFLEKIDGFIRRKISGYQRPETGPETFSPLEEYRLFREFVYFDAFREQLRELLKFYKLPTEVCDDDERWFAFVGAYVGVIEDGTLSAGNSKRLQAVATVTLSKGRVLPPKHHVPFKIRWDIVLKDGRTCRIEVDATPKLKMIFHGITILPAR
jgi:hypothetical protein